MQNASEPSLSSCVTGIVLAGGLSSRLGQDKASLTLDIAEYADLLGRTAKLLRALLGEVYIAGRHHPDYPSFFDDVPGLGPVGGIATSLRNTGKACFALSCDLPFMDLDVLRRLLDFRAARPPGVLMTAYCQEETGYSEPLIAIYEYGALPYFQEAVDGRLLKITRIVPKELQRHLPYGREASLPFFNVNYPADLEIARRVLLQQKELKD